MASPQAVPNELGLRVQQSIRKEAEQREPLALAYVLVGCVVMLCAFALFIEWKNIAMALRQLFPTLSNGQGYDDVTGTLAFASVAAIVFGDVLLEKASAHWSERTKRLVDVIGLVALVLFVISAMLLLPTSVVQANDSADAAGDGVVSRGAYLAFALMLAALFPVSLLANFVLFERLKPALAKIQRSLEIERRVRSKRRVLRQYEAARASLRAVQGRLDTLPEPSQVVDEYAAFADAVIGRARGRIGEIIVARETAAGSGGETPLLATDDHLFNHQPMEKLRAHYDYLRTFAPDSIRRIITGKEA
jgi:hypothetical protein